ncbi:MAG: acylglycerol kinase family protein [Acidobacteria bacterium]|nr:acylglycerol kinase family protein [Acidobacteriota bacterium]
MNMKTLAIVNPAAGFGKCAKLLGPAIDRLHASGIEFDVAMTERAGHATELAREAFKNGYRRFFAVGGDGTSFEMVNGLFPEAWNGVRRRNARRLDFCRWAQATPSSRTSPMKELNSASRQSSKTARNHATSSNSNTKPGRSITSTFSAWVL